MTEEGTNESNADSLTAARTQALARTQPTSRRENRLARESAFVNPQPARTISAAPAAPRRRWGSTVAVALAVPALFGTVALPAYAAGLPGQKGSTASTTDSAQSFAVDSAVAETAALQRDGFDATSDAEISAANAAQIQAQRTADAVASRAAFAASQTSYKGATVVDANAPVPSYSLAAVFSEGLKYQGVPYVLGGATPAGFDCSGFVKYVFAKFGINLPHNADTQGRMGTKINVADAVPGDLVVSAGHIGFYAGNGMMLHASRPGVPLRIGPIYAKSWSIVRIAG
ncbi:C40 family peptidase [Mycetocola tolaasinivorans]|uniref:C40 family peptidase n=1 Tax=Mycetocola tolaasinivorans TaxID=76635 RepID=UPI0016006D88|nr:C40 family peptidase [Mycetocola tolaasinivorans]